VRRLRLAGLVVPLAVTLHAQTLVNTVKVLDSKDAVEIEIAGSNRLVPQTRVLTGPDRLVIDFPNAVPGRELRSQSVYRGEVKDLRIGLFQSRPPVTRIVLDLKSAQSYQVFPSGRSVMIKVVGSGADTSAGVDEFPAAKRPGLVAANFTTGSERVQVEPPKPSPLDVTFRNGMLSIRADKSTLSAILLAVQQSTGAQVALAPGAEQETVVVNLGPAPAPEVMERLLYGSKFNFLILSATDDPRRLDRVILSPRTEGAAISMPLPQVVNAANPPEADDDSNEPPQGPPGQPIPQSQPEIKAAPDDTPDQ
jgi:hypothetical protein